MWGYNKGSTVESKAKWAFCILALYGFLFFISKFHKMIDCLKLSGTSTVQFISGEYLVGFKMLKHLKRVLSSISVFPCWRNLVLEKKRNGSFQILCTFSFWILLSYHFWTCTCGENNVFKRIEYVSLSRNWITVNLTKRIT